MRRYPAADPVASRVRALDLGQTGDTGGGRDRDVGGLARLLLQLLEERKRKSSEVARGSVAAGIVDQDRTRPEAATRLALS
jgi:hypothetical protein